MNTRYLQTLEAQLDLLRFYTGPKAAAIRRRMRQWLRTERRYQGGHTDMV